VVYTYNRKEGAMKTNLEISAAIRALLKERDKLPDLPAWDASYSVISAQIRALEWALGIGGDLVRQGDGDENL
jgi:hypothetical protein